MYVTTKLKSLFATFSVGTLTCFVLNWIKSSTNTDVSNAREIDFDDHGAKNLVWFIEVGRVFTRPRDSFLYPQNT